ncbi:hypothetical protein MP477_01875 [Chryseobacterium sp. WG23]|uniref:hypothetical protein n=1 Tax=Chryseobacterium sp. WG23 TaxID=2926910 RepID=UPI00211EE1D1|nr:hypothetical protein [Chryseobacterium sp. WG23]MCQ9633700.1 hypothetical protein [Chryseobacterium sp. WG23]
MFSIFHGLLPMYPVNKAFVLHNPYGFLFYCSSLHDFVVAVLGLLSLWFIWVQKDDKWAVFRLSIIFASLYWITQAMSILFPGTALFDPEFSYPDQWPVQFISDGTMFLLLIMAYFLESKHLDRLK